MGLKFLNWLGIAACLTLIICCFLPLVYYPDLKQSFTGFYTYNNEYGKPGKLLVAIGFIAFILMLVPKLWAKRINLFVTALGMGYAIKTYVLFTSCYSGYCPDKLIGIYLVMAASVIMLIASVFPGIKLDTEIKKH